MRDKEERRNKKCYHNYQRGKIVYKMTVITFEIRTSLKSSKDTGTTNFVTDRVRVSFMIYS